MPFTSKEIEFLQTTLPFWNHLTPVQQDSLKKDIVKQHFSVGESLHTGSENCSGLFLIQSGQLRVYMISESGREVTLYRLFDRDVCIFSASCIMRNITFDVYVEIEKDTDCFLLPTASYRQLANEAISVQAFMNDLMESRFSDVMWVIDQVLFASFDRRLSNFLLEQSNIQQSDTIMITHEKIANNIGSAREVVTRMLKYFQSEGIVRLFRGGIEILNKKKLQE